VHGTFTSLARPFRRPGRSWEVDVEESRDKKWREATRWVAVVAVGAFVGSVLIGPAMAHLNRPLTFEHLKKHFYTKKLANSTFISVGEKASDSDKLDGKDSTEFLQDASVFLEKSQLGWAVVQANGTLVRGVNTTSAAKLATGNYEVVFSRDVSQCAFQATISDSTLAAEIGAEPRTGNANAVFVTTWASNANPADKPFHLFVICA
jgi:hypothetical protein